MKKILILSLFMCLLFFSGCNKKIENVENESINSINNFTEAENELYMILNEINSKVEVGTAGSSLKAVSYTSNLMNWAIGTTLTKEQISKVVNFKLNELDNTKIDFVDQMSLLENTYKELLLPSRNELLKTSGNNENYAWTDVLNEEITTLVNADYLFDRFKNIK